MRIGDFARMGNVPVRAFRFYDAIRLLRPLHVDPDSGFGTTALGKLGACTKFVLSRISVCR
jgi:hypothetical protein